MLTDVHGIHVSVRADFQVVERAFQRFIHFPHGDCGCSSGPAGAGLSVVMFALVLLRRREDA